jgi:AraC-like DNA-binding protein
MINYRTIAPSEKLANFVRYFWILESDQPYTHYSMADVCPELLFHYKGRFNEISDNGHSEKSFTAGIHGQTSFTRKFQIDCGFGIVAVYFYPYAIPLLFGVSATELTNQMADLNGLTKAVGTALEEDIAAATGSIQRIAIIEKFLERRLPSSTCKEQSPVFHSIQAILKNKGQMTVKQLAGHFFLSERQFERQFQHFAGFNPKLFSRIVRFQSAIAQYGNTQKSLTEIALESGYYDQSHFIHDFKEFSAHHPKHYFSGNSEATAWRD